MTRLRGPQLAQRGSDRSTGATPCAPAALTPTTRRIVARWKASNERPRIVAMTANAMQGDREECLAAGMDDYVTMPIRVEALVQALHAVPRQGIS
jgi:CheY-like chemotaxis protein